MIATYTVLKAVQVPGGTRGSCRAPASGQLMEGAFGASPSPALGACCHAGMGGVLVHKPLAGRQGSPVRYSRQGVNNVLIHSAGDTKLVNSSLNFGFISGGQFISIIIPLSA